MEYCNLLIWIILFVLHCDVILCLQTNGFALRGYNGIDSLSMSCDTAGLPDDVRNVLSVNIQHRDMSSGGQSRVIGSMSPLGKSNNTNTLPLFSNMTNTRLHISFRKCIMEISLSETQVRH